MCPRTVRQLCFPWPDLAAEVARRHQGRCTRLEACTLLPARCCLHAAVRADLAGLISLAICGVAKRANPHTCRLARAEARRWASTQEDSYERACSRGANPFLASLTRVRFVKCDLALIHIFSDMALYFDRHIFTRKHQNIPLLHTPQKGVEDTERKKSRCVGCEHRD